MRPNAERNPWIAHAQRNPRARLRLFCFPYAGGSALTYRPWKDRVPGDVEVLPVEIPGRASRFREAPIQRLDDLVPAIAEGIASELDQPYAFFGHSMGSLLSFELARHLRRQGGEQPRALLVSARRAPQLPPEREDVHKLPEPEFIERLRTLNGTPEEVLEHPELMQMLLPVLRADFEVNETYEYREEEPLEMPISAFGGLGDEDIPRENLAAWKEQTRAGFSVRMFPGDHFYIDKAQGPLLYALAQDLASVTRTL